MTAAVDSAIPAAEAKGIRLKAILGPTEDIVSADSARLQQVAGNLLILVAAGLVGR